MKTRVFSFFNSEVATRFETNFKAQRPDDSILEYFSKQGLNPGMVLSAFMWCETPEKHQYWETIDILWREFVEGKRGSLPEDLDMEEVALQKRFEIKLQKIKPKPLEIIKEFSSLFGEKIYESFKKNFKKGSDRYRDFQNLIAFLEDQVNISKVDSIVNAAFEWGNTPEGYDYWKHIHEMWKTYWRTRSGVLKG